MFDKQLSVELCWWQDFMEKSTGWAKWFAQRIIRMLEQRIPSK